MVIFQVKWAAGGPIPFPPITVFAFVPAIKETKWPNKSQQHRASS